MNAPNRGRELNFKDIIAASLRNARGESEVRFCNG